MSRAPLVWDEAARVDAGAGLVLAIRHTSLPEVWNWLNDQTFYPFLGPAFNGLVLLVSGNPLLAAWLPSLLAYGVAGILGYIAARDTGTSRIGGWAAASLIWSTPLLTRLAAGDFTEPFGACGTLLLVICEVRNQTTRGRLYSVLSGATVAACWFLKYDYGMLAFAILITNRLLQLRQGHAKLDDIKAIATSILAALLPVLVWLSINTGLKMQGISGFVGQAAPGGEAISRLAFYPLALVASPEVGLASTVGLFLLISIVVGFVQGGHYILRPALIAVTLWSIMYTAASIKYARYLGTILPVLCVIGAVLADRLLLNLRLASPASNQPFVAAVAFLLGAQLLLQLTDPTTGVSAQFWFLRMDPVAAEATEFAAGHLDSNLGPVLMLGQTNEVSPGLVHLMWTERLGHLAPTVYTLPGSSAGLIGPTDLTAQIRSRFVSQLIGFTVRTGSRLDTADYHRSFPNQPLYLDAARHMEESGQLRLIAESTMENGLLEVEVWRFGP